MIRFMPSGCQSNATRFARRPLNHRILLYHQLVTVNLFCFGQVLLGGGRRHWIPDTEFDSEIRSERGRRKDGKNLIDAWVWDKKDRDLHSEYVSDKQQFNKIDSKKTDYLLGKL